MDIDSEMTLTAEDGPRRHGNDIRVPSFGRVFNEAALAFLHSYDAQGKLRDTRHEAERHKPSFQAFPANRHRFDVMLSTARKKEAEAKAKEKEQTDKLDDSFLDMVQKLTKNELVTIFGSSDFENAVRAVISVDDRLGHGHGKSEDCAISKSKSDALKYEINTQHQWMVEQAAQFERRLQQSENAYRERLEASEIAMKQKLDASEIAIKHKLDYVEGEQKGIRSQMDEISTSNTGLLERVDALERKMRDLLDTSRLEMANEAEEVNKAEEPIDIKDSVPTLAKALENIRLRSLKNRDALKNSEALFNKLFDAVQNLHDNSGALQEELADLKASQAEEKQIDKTSNTVSQNRENTSENMVKLEQRLDNKIDDKVETMHMVIETMTKQLISHVDDQVRGVSSGFAKVEDVTELQSFFRSELERVIASSVNMAVISGLDASIAQLSDRVNTRLSVQDEQCGRLEKEVQGAQIAVKHLTKRLDNHSADEIVGKINMNLRNVNLSQLSKVQNNVNILSHNVKFLTNDVNSIKARLDTPTRNGNP